MEVNPISSQATQDVSASATVARSVATGTTDAAAEDISVGAETKTNTEAVPKQQQEKSLSREDMEKITDKMTKFMASLNTDIQFSLHEGTGRLVVKVVDKQTDKVLKEFPPHQLLDTMAAISQYIGGLLDKKA